MGSRPGAEAGTGSRLEGFGTQGLGRAFLLVRQELEDNKRLEERINGGMSAMRRREVWATMFAQYRDFLASPEGREATPPTRTWLRSRRCGSPMRRCGRRCRTRPGLGEKALHYVRSAVGLESDPLGGYWVTRKGLALEPWGTLGGGYCGNYGLICVHEITALARPDRR